MGLAPFSNDLPDVTILSFLRSKPVISYDVTCFLFPASVI